MPDSGPTGSPARAAALLALSLIALGGVIILATYLLRSPKLVSSAPTPSALFKPAEFLLPPHQQACMSQITIASGSRVAQFRVREVAGSTSGSPPIDVTLTAVGYNAVAHLPASQEGQTALRITPPPRDVIGTVCFLNTGTVAGRLEGSRELRGAARAALTINGTATAGDIALTLLDNRKKSRLARTGEVFTHASNLTDHLVPTWLIWLLALAGIFGIPLATVAAFHRALAEDGLR